MAKEVQSAEKELSVEEKLSALYQLQVMLSEIDKIKTLRGELPLEVQDLEDEIIGLETRVENYQNEIKEQSTAISEQKNSIQQSKALIERYNEQISNVRNNREFDNLSKELEYQTLEVELAEKRIREYDFSIKNKDEELTQISANLVERKEDLKVKKEELDSIVAETKQEEEKLREKAKKLEGNIEERLLTAFKRIRKSAHNGLAVVTIQRDSCGGCFNKIPPQRQMDIKLRKKIIVCEYCGRIMIDPDMTAEAAAN